MPQQPNRWGFAAFLVKMERPNGMEASFLIAGIDMNMLLSSMDTMMADNRLVGYGYEPTEIPPYQAFLPYRLVQCVQWFLAQE